MSLLNKLKSANTLKIIILIVFSFLSAWMFQFICFGKPAFIVTGSFFFLALSIRDRSRLCLYVFSAFLALVLPSAKVFGSGVINPAALDVLMTTNFSEAVGFHEVLPVNILLPGIALFIFYILLIIFNRELSLTNFSFLNSNEKKFSRVKTVIFLFITVLVIFNGYKAFAPRIIDLYDSYLFIIDNAEPKNADFKILSRKDKYDTYVVIIGESMRADFMSAYGFPVKTTPNIDKLNKYLIKNFISPAPSTTLSVPRFLSITKDGELQDHNNAVNMAKGAGFDTYWISSQGFSGDTVSPAGRVARYADFKSFVPYPNDYLLLPIIEETIKRGHKKVIFVHILGSHENPCSKLNGYPNNYHYKVGKIMNCYLATYNRTDEFIERIVSMLKNNTKSYSLVYFADHGLNFVNNSGEFKILRDPEIKQSYLVPFFVVASDINDNKVFDITRSAYRMMDFYASWFGVTTDMTENEYDIFNSESDSAPKVVMYDFKLNSFNERKDGITASEVYNSMKK